MRKDLCIFLFDHSYNKVDTPINLWIRENPAVRHKALMHSCASAKLEKIQTWNPVSRNYEIDPGATETVQMFCYPYQFNSSETKSLDRNYFQLLKFLEHATPEHNSKIYIVNAHCNSGNDVLDCDGKGKSIFDTEKMAKDFAQWLPNHYNEAYHFIVLSCRAGQLFSKAFSWYLNKYKLKAKVTGYTEIMECIPREFNIESNHIVVTIPRNPMIIPAPEDDAFDVLMEKRPPITINEFAKSNNYKKVYKITWQKDGCSKNTPSYHYTPELSDESE